MRYVRIILLGLLALAALFAGSSPAMSQGGPFLPDRVDKLHPKLESQLSRLVQEYRSGGIAAAEEQARVHGIHLHGQRVRVIVQGRLGRGAQSATAALRVGGEVEAAYRDLVQVLAPLAKLEALADEESVRFVRQPLRVVPAVLGQGVPLIGADSWQAAGVDGSGVKVAVLDAGFQGYTSLLGSELPSSVVTHSCRADNDITGGGIEHGTAVAEIVHEVAPGASLYLVNFDTEVELGNCVDWLIGQGVDIINFSIGFTISGPGDGTGLVNEIVNNATVAGIFWASAAGNEADRHWSGNWNDPDNDGFLNFVGADWTNQLLLFAGEPLIVELKWDDSWHSSCNDYDLYVFDDFLNLVGFSDNVQDCFSWTPTESLGIIAPYDDIYHIVINRFAAAGTSRFHLYTWPWSPEHTTSAASLCQPADGPDVAAVGAVDWAAPNTIEPFSSRGPTDDGRTKPDIVGPDGVSNATLGSFFGTSASSPHAAGAAVLVKQLLSCYTRTDIQSFLEGQALDLGTAGKDNVYGSGRLALGVVPDNTDADLALSGATVSGIPLPGDSDGDACDDDDDNDAFNGTTTLTRAAGAAATACPAGSVPVWADCVESYLGTNALDNCGPNAWPPDIVWTNQVSGGDAFAIMDFWLTSVSRYDLDASGAVSGGDVFLLFDWWLATCT